MTAPSPKTLTAENLKTLLAEKGDLLLLDVLTPESFAQEHLPGAQNACVYQTDFLDLAGKLIESQDQCVVVYDADRGSIASTVAAEKLAAAGYKQVLDFTGGLEEWRVAGELVEGANANARSSSAAEKQSRTCQIDPEESLVEWTGRNIVNRHHGTIRVAGGQLRIENGTATNGEVVLDINSIASTDIEDADMAKMLAGHLKSDDFFDAATFPEAKFILREIAPIADSTPGVPNHTVRGTLTMKGIEHPVEFDAAIAETADGNLVAQATFEIDRTKWNVLYGSGKFFARLGKHLVNDLIAIHLKIVAN